MPTKSANTQKETFQLKLNFDSVKSTVYSAIHGKNARIIDLQDYARKRVIAQALKETKSF